MTLSPLRRRASLTVGVAAAVVAGLTPAGPAVAGPVPATGAVAGPVASTAVASKGVASSGALARPSVGSAVSGPVGAAAPDRHATGLAVSVTPARVRARQAVTIAGKLTRRSDGLKVSGRVVRIYGQAADSDRWTLLASLRTGRDGRVVHRRALRTDQQFTLRFAGDTRFGPAASYTLAVDVRPYAAGVHRSLSSAVARARADARRAGVTLTVNSGFRSWEKQQVMFLEATRRYGSVRAARVWVLPPQESAHVRGRAMDLGPPSAAAWLAARSARYGLCRAYANEPWHFEYHPEWIRKAGGRCPRPAAKPGDPAPYSPAPRVPALGGSTSASS